MSVYSAKVSVDDGIMLDLPGSSGRKYFESTFLGHSMQATWKGLTPYPNIDPGYRENDFMICLSSAAYVLSSLAADQISRIQNKGFELLEVTVHARSKPYYILNVDTVTDCLDKQRSKMLYASDDPQKLLLVERPQFVPTRVPDVAAFKVPELRNRFFVTKPFVDVVLESKLTGIYFEDPAKEEFALKQPLWGTPFLRQAPAKN